MEIFDAYLVTGGYPRLVERCSAARSTSAYVKAALIDPFSDLVISAQLMLDAEFTDAASARQVLTAIGAEAVIRPGFNDVVSAISDPGERGAAQTAITRALKILEGPKDLIRIEVPSGAASNSRLRRYRLNLLLEAAPEGTSIRIRSLGPSRIFSARVIAVWAAP